MKLATTIAFDGDPAKLVARVTDLERAGIDRVWGGEIYGFDLVSTLAYLAGQTERVELMTGILPVYSRSPALIAQTAATIDALSGGPLRAGPRHVRSPGDRGLARLPVRQAVGPHP